MKPTKLFMVALLSCGLLLGATSGCRLLKAGGKVARHVGQQQRREQERKNDQAAQPAASPTPTR